MDIAVIATARIPIAFFFEFCILRGIFSTTPMGCALCLRLVAAVGLEPTTYGL